MLLKIPFNLPILSNILIESRSMHGEGGGSSMGTGLAGGLDFFHPKVADTIQNTTITKNTSPTMILINTYGSDSSVAGSGVSVIERWKRLKLYQWSLILSISLSSELNLEHSQIFKF